MLKSCTKLKSNKKFNSNKDCNLIQNDAFEVLPLIPDGYADHCITDPPYSVSDYDHKKKIGWLNSNKYWSDTKKFKKINENWDKFYGDDYEVFTISWLKEIFRIVKPNGNLIIFGSYHNIYKIGYLLQKLNKRVINSIVWYKRNAFPNITQRMFCESTEHIIWATNNDKKHAKNWIFNYQVMKKINNGVQMRNVWDIPMTPKSEKTYGGHPAQKNKEVVERLVLGCTNKKDVIIDPFMGAGTIPLACLENSRKCVGIEKNTQYFSTACKRLKNGKIFFVDII